MFEDSKTGKAMTFSEAIVAVLVAEHQRTWDEAKELVTKYPAIIKHGLMTGVNVRATALAIDSEESK